MNWLDSILNFANTISGAGSALSGQDFDFEDFNKILDKLKKSKKKSSSDKAEPSKEEAEPDAVEEYKRQAADMSDEEFKKYKERLKELRELSKEKPKFFERLYNAGMALQGVHVPNRSDERFAGYLNQFGQLLNLKRQQASDIGSLMAEQARTDAAKEATLYNTAARLYEALTGRQERQKEMAEKARQDYVNWIREQLANAGKYRQEEKRLTQTLTGHLLGPILEALLKYSLAQKPGEFVEALRGGSFKKLQEGGLPETSNPIEQALLNAARYREYIQRLLGIQPETQPPVPTPPTVPTPQPPPEVPSLKPPQTQPPPGWFEQFFQGLGGGKNKVLLPFLQGIGLGGVGSPFAHEGRIY